MYLARIAIVQPLVDVPAAVVSGGVKTCTKFQGTLRLFEAFTSTNPTTGNLRTVASEIIEVMHAGEQPLEAGMDVLVGQQVDEVWVTECPYE